MLLFLPLFTSLLSLFCWFSTSFPIFQTRPNNALLLEDEEHSIIASGRYSIEDVLYGRFYWYTKFLCRYEAIYGKNGSMEQAQFKIIEAMDYKGIVDSDALELIEQELGYTE